MDVKRNSQSIGNDQAHFAGLIFCGALVIVVKLILIISNGPYFFYIGTLIQFPVSCISLVILT